MSKYQENIGPSDGLTTKNVALLLIDHQVGLMQLVRDMNPEEFKNNVVGLAKTAKIFGLPVILTTSMDWGPAGVTCSILQRLMAPDRWYLLNKGDTLIDAMYHTCYFLYANKPFKIKN
jgi:nicotinamidase-related amidase